MNLLISYESNFYSSDKFTSSFNYIPTYNHWLYQWKEQVPSYLAIFGLAFIFDLHLVNMNVLLGFTNNFPCNVIRLISRILPLTCNPLYFRQQLTKNMFLVWKVCDNFYFEIYFCLLTILIGSWTTHVESLTPLILWYNWQC